MSTTTPKPLGGKRLTFAILVGVCLAATSIGLLARGIPMLEQAAARVPLSPLSLALLGAIALELVFTILTQALFLKRRTAFRPAFIAACLCRALRSLAHIVLSFFALQLPYDALQFLDMTAAVLGLVIALIMLIYWARHFAGARHLGLYLTTGSYFAGPESVLRPLRPRPGHKGPDPQLADQFKLLD